MPPDDSPLGIRRRSKRVESNLNARDTHKRLRRSQRGTKGLPALAQRIVRGDKIVVITGAGLSVPSGVRPFRSHSGCRRTAVPSQNGLPSTKGLWNEVVWTTATREAFQKNTVQWYNEFWIPHFADGMTYHQNTGHLAMEALQQVYPNIVQITQNIDGLQTPHERLIEAHGRAGLYKCLGPCDDEEDSDDTENEESESDDEENRPVQLGHRRSSQSFKQEAASPEACPYRYLQSLTPSQLEPDWTRIALERGNLLPGKAPRCPVCDSLVMPQALLFDEGYHSHSFYEFEKAEKWLAEADVLVFVGTSFAVRLTTVTLQHARKARIPVYNLNPHDFLEANSRLNATNIVGSADNLLPALVEACEQAAKELGDSSVSSNQSWA